MSNPLPASDLMHQASETTATYLNDAIRIIDKKFYAGYAQQNPRLTGDFMKTAALGYSASIQAQQQEILIEEINRLVSALESTADAMESLAVKEEIQMKKDRELLMNDGFMAANDLIYNSAECVAALINLPCGEESKKTVLKHHPMIVCTHALLAFLDAHYEEHYPPNAGKEELHAAGFARQGSEMAQAWLSAWEKAHPNQPRTERRTPAEIFQWLGQLSEGGQ